MLAGESPYYRKTYTYNLPIYLFLSISVFIIILRGGDSASANTVSLPSTLKILHFFSQ